MVREIGRNLSDWTKAETMLGDGAEILQGLAMRSCTVANMPLKTVVWVSSEKFMHIIISCNFGDNGSGRDFFDEGIGLFKSRNIMSEWSVG